MKPPAGSNVDVLSVLAAGFAFLMFILSIVMWPVYIAGIQILTAEIVRGNRFSLVAVLNEAVRFWPRVAALCIFVYGVFFLLMVFGLAIAAMSLAAGSSVLLVLVAMALLILQVWMFGRFFVNVLFWQQFTVLENAGFIDSLRESRDLARSGRDLPWFQRPIVARCIHRLHLVCRCAGDHARCAVGDAAPVLESIDDDTRPSGVVATNDRGAESQRF